MCKFYFGYRRHIHTSQLFAPISSRPQSHVALNIIIFQYNTSEMTDGLCCSFPQWGGYGKGFGREKPAALVLGNCRRERAKCSACHLPVCWSVLGLNRHQNHQLCFILLFARKTWRREKKKGRKKRKKQKGKRDWSNAYTRWAFKLKNELRN